MNRVPPPKPPLPPMIDSAEFLALRTIVMVLVARLANDHEGSGQGAAQEFLNLVSALCQEAILGGDTSADSVARSERMRRRKALEHVNHILEGIRFPDDRSKTN